MLRVLCFCGFTRNKYIFDQELSRLQAQCKDTVEFVFLEPPSAVEPADFPLLSQDARKSAGWSVPRIPETTPRTWFAGDKDWHGDRGFVEGLQYVRDFLIENEPFDGFFAFSSGSTLANVVVAYLMNADRSYDPSFPPHPRLQKPRFYIVCSSFFIGRCISPHPSYMPLFPISATLPTLHIMGTNDTIVVPEESLFVAGLFKNRRIEKHHGDHFVPMKASWRGFFQAYIESFLPDGTEGHGIPPPNEFSPAVIAKSRSPLSPRFTSDMSVYAEKMMMPTPFIRVSLPDMPFDKRLSESSSFVAHE